MTSVPGCTVVSTDAQNPAGLVPASSDTIYDALNPKGRRRQAARQATKPEDVLMTSTRRDDLNANAYDVHRNVAMLQWMVRQTLNYCCTFDVRFQTNDDGLNRALLDCMERDCDQSRVDYVGRMDWDDMRRVAESLKICGGDAFFIPLREGTLQMMEGPTCRNPRDQGTGRWCHGAKLNRRNRITRWNFRDVPLTRTDQAIDRQIAARNVWQHVQYEGRAHPVRGVSVVNCILNELRDVYEGFDYARAKMKLDQIFGVQIVRRQIGDDDDLARTVNHNGESVADGEAEDSEADEPLKLDFSQGPVVIDRDDVENVNMMQSSNPAQSTQEFLKLCIMVALIALDLPFNFFDASSTNFFGSRAAWILYERSCMARRKTQLRLHKRMTRWRLFRWSLPERLGGTGEIKLPKSLRIDDIRYVWIPRGIPWWKPKEELEANMQAVALGWKTNQSVCDENGFGLYEENLKELERERNIAARYGFVLRQNDQKLASSLQPLNTPNART